MASQPLHSISLQQSQSQYTIPHSGRPSLSNGRSMSTLKCPTKIRHHPYSNINSMVGFGHQSSLDSGFHSDEMQRSSGPVRRRISRACDQCNQLRTKCDGRDPCAHCVGRLLFSVDLIRVDNSQEFDLTCEYVRERKKRGKVSRKDLARHGTEVMKTGYSSDAPSPTISANVHGHSDLHEQSSIDTEPSRDVAPHLIRRNETEDHQGVTKIDISGDPQQAQHQISVGDRSKHLANRQSLNRNGASNRPTAISLNGFGLKHGYDRFGLHGGSSASQGIPSVAVPGPTVQAASFPSSHSQMEGSFPLTAPQEPQVATPGFRFTGISESPVAGFTSGSSMAGSPGWLPLPSPSPGIYPPHHHLLSPAVTLKYPVLRPLLPHIASIIPTSLACDLLELYFCSSSSVHLHPVSPYVIGYVFRKQSFLDKHRPRSCSPALLSSMLWVAAQTSDSPFLTSPPAARGRICQKLLEITVGFLRPLVHGPAVGETSPTHGINTAIDGVALGGLGAAMTGGDQLTAEGGATDSLAAYCHLATIVSASEYKAASLRWWNAAWSLARELKFGRELPPNPPQIVVGQHPHKGDLDSNGTVDIPMGEQTTVRLTPKAHSPTDGPGFVSEEEREERRRIWWLLYTIDRHLALCYNRPLFLLDAECDGLLQPMSDVAWQAGDFHTSDSNPFDPTSPQFRPRGPSLKCTGHSMFGFFHPLMTILGEIVDLNAARNHPRFGVGFHSPGAWDQHVREITRQLEVYGESLKDFEARETVKDKASSSDSSNPEKGDGPVSPSSAHSVISASPRMSDCLIQTKIVVAYGTHVMHVLHVLLTGKWDPISLLDDNDLWISSQSFINATGHAVAAAESISDILEYDPDLSFMPWFFGISLLQGSFLLLLIADKLQGEASPSVVKACENIVRAHEVCIVTLNTEYQVSRLAAKALAFLLADVHLLLASFLVGLLILTSLSQRNFRKVMQSALAQVRGRTAEDFGEQQLRRREVLALYRWTGDGTGLAL